MTLRLMQSRWIRLFQSDVVLKISLVLTVLSIFVPFVYMKIGPMGYRYYGPNVPDIYIFGGYIFGKDTSFWGINVAYKIQLGSILLIAYNQWRYLSTQRVKFMILNASLLLLFPIWLEAYVGGVVCNSDGADLTVYWHSMPGIWVWGVVFALHIVMLFARFRKSV